LNENSVTAHATTSHHFDELELSEEMRETLRRVEYQHPTPVQFGVIPGIMAGRDLIGQARTGTGKTAAFAIPMIERFQALGKTRRPRGLVLVPTRELAAQVVAEFRKLSQHTRLQVATIVGGEPMRGQLSTLKKGTHVVVGTPGRVIDHLDRHTLDLSRLQVVVLDEADRMLDIGFRPDIERILRRCPDARQTLLLSATLPAPILRLADRYMRDPEQLDFSGGGVGCSTIEQFYFTVEPDQKFELLCQLLRRERPRQAIVFCRTRRRTEEIYRRLSRKMRGAAAIHGDMRQSERNRVMGDFRAGKIRLLVATDVVGRGIDVTSISHIINYDLPEDCDDYVHRVGRTGRMGREGVSYTFVTQEQGEALTRIEMRIDRLLVKDQIDLPAQQTSTESEPPSPPTETMVEAEAPPEPLGSRKRRHRRAL
jgi:ATP-dependent RNA helicase DeaD